MNEEQVKRIINSPEFQEMAKKKTSLGMVFSILTLVIYVGYMLLLGLAPQIFAEPISAGSVTSVGVVVGMGVIAFCFIITAIYVAKANGEFDNLTKKVIDKVNDGSL